ncbi:MAG TPA: cupredoxin domain-containing protein [Opitutaceae bacterium]|nr:cupredoxin domain-containing protein [Opitutaceae bacterium]
MPIKALVFICLTTFVAGASPSNPPETIPEIRFANHRFSPQTLLVQAGQPLQIKVVNSSREKIEFESFSLNREKVIEPGKSITVRLPALRAGSYDFFDDFHDNVPEGVIVAESADSANIQRPTPGNKP